MAITTFNIPSSLQPAHNQCILTFDSDEKLQKGFRYILRVEDNSANEIARYSIPPRLGDGIGYADVSKVIQSQLGYYNPINVALFQDGIEPQYGIFRFLIGEEYQVAYTYSQPQQNGLYVELVGTTTTTFIAGDQININQADGGLSMPQLQGLFTVVSVSGNDVTINVLWADIIPSVVAGSVTYVDGRKTQFLDQFDETINLYDSAFSFKDFQSYDPTDYILANGLIKLPFSNIPQTGFKINPTQDIFLWCYANGLTGTQFRVTITSFAGASAEGTFRYVADATNLGQLLRVAGEFTGITVLTGALPVVKPTTTKIVVTFQTLAGVTIMPTHTFDIDQSCAIEDFEVLFYDRLGSWGSFAFPLKSQGSLKVSKKSYEQELGTVDISGFTYELDNVGIETYNIQANEDLTLTTRVLNDVELEYFEQLISSPKTFIKIGGVYYGCDVMTTDVDKNRNVNKRLIRRTINVRLSNDTPING